MWSGHTSRDALGTQDSGERGRGGFLQSLDETTEKPRSPRRSGRVMQGRLWQVRGPPGRWGVLGVMGGGEDMA